MHVFLANVLGSVCKTCALMVSVIEPGVGGMEICCFLSFSLSLSVSLCLYLSLSSLFFFLVVIVLGFELSTSHLLHRCSTI
jgi:hypothetical protein